VIEGRNEIEVGDPLAGDQAQRLSGLIARQAHKDTVDQHHRQQRTHPHRVVERHRAESALADAVKVLSDMGECCGALGAVAARHAFRRPGGSQGVKDQGEILWPSLRRVLPANIGKGLEVVGGARGSADRYPRQYVGCRRTGDGGRRNLLIDDRVGFCVSYAKVELFGFGPQLRGTMTKPAS
jgi:hypothetical protein